MKSDKVLCLDVEGTLISNAVSQIPRPFLYEFLETCMQSFTRICLYTTVPEDKVVVVMEGLVKEYYVPAEFLKAYEYVQWERKGQKDLNLVPNCEPEDCILVDDMETYILDAQSEQWIQIEPFDFPYPDTDTELKDVVKRLGIDFKN